MNLLQKIPHKHKFDFGKQKTFERLSLKNGSHTMVIGFACWCGKMQSFPTNNLKLALREGTEKTLILLQKHFDLKELK